MDSFGASTRHHQKPMSSDVLLTSSRTMKKPAAQTASVRDSFDVSERDFDQIAQTVIDERITDLDQIKDIISYHKHSNSIQDRFNIDSLTDYQLSRLISIVRENIAEKIANRILKSKNNDKFITMTQQEKASIANILNRLRQSQITNIAQAIDFVRNNSVDNPGLFAKISSNLLSIVQNNQTAFTASTGPRNDIYVPTGAVSPFETQINPFKKDIRFRLFNKDISDESLAFVNNILSTDRERLNSYNPETIEQVTNLIIAHYLKDRNNVILPEEVIKSSISQIKIEDQIWYQDNILHTSVSYINDIAAKIATEKAQTIITCRIVGEVSGSMAFALGTAYVVGTSPLIGLLGAFSLTLFAAILGLTLGKTAGEEFGKLITGTNLTHDSDYSQDVAKYYSKKNSNQQGSKDQEKNEQEENTEEESSKTPAEPEDNSPFNYIDREVSDVLRERVLYRRPKTH